MILHVLRALFVLLMAAVGWFYIGQKNFFVGGENVEIGWLVMAAVLSLSVLLICIDILSPRKKLVVFSGTFLGLLVGLGIAYGLSFVIKLITDQYLPVDLLAKDFKLQQAHHDVVVEFANVIVGAICCYLAISFILQTKDDFRFIIPYVEFSKQTKGARPILVDTSVIIDGRIVDIADTGVFESRLVVPRFVLSELQLIADSAEKLKRNRGRRGLDVLNKLQGHKKLEVILYDSSIREPSEDPGVDQKLMSLAKEMNARVMTNDFNLSKVAQLRGVDVININDLANALKPIVLPGEKMQVKLLKPGEEPTQGVGYLEDGTMVVVEQGRQHLNEDVEFTVTSVLQTSAGRMIFGRMGDGFGAPRRSRSKAEA